MCIDCVDYPVCCLFGRCADDEPCEYFQEETDPEEPGDNKDKNYERKKTKCYADSYKGKVFIIESKVIERWRVRRTL